MPAEDSGVYEMLSRANSIGVFQVESRAQQTMLPRLKPRCFYDLVIEVAIVRPGPIQGDMVHPYLRRRQGLEKTSYPSEELKEILEKTLGVPLFQEQCMRIAIVAAGFQPARADELRRAMATFKKVGTIHTFKDEFIRGMLAKNYKRDFAERCFSQIQGFGTYGFPESHAASFALLVYCSAWLKRYYPDVFAAAILNSQPMGFYAPAQLVRDAREHGVEVRPIDVNASEWDHTLEAVAKPPHPNPLPRGERGEAAAAEKAFPLPSAGEGQGEGAFPPGNRHALRLGLRLVAGLREEDAKRLVEARQQGGPFLTPEDLMRRAKLRAPAMRTLARADAFSSLDLARRETLWHVAGLEADVLPLLPSSAWRGGNSQPLRRRPLSHPHPLADADTLKKQARQGELARERDMKRVRGEPELPPLRDEESVTEDYSAFGLSLRNHPMAFMRGALRAKGMVTAAELKNLPDGRHVKIAGLVLFRQRPATAKGTIFITIEDETGAANLIVWPKIAAQYRRAVFGAKVLLCEGVLQKESDVIHVVSRHLTDWTAMLKNLQPGQSDALQPATQPRRPSFPQLRLHHPNKKKCSFELDKFLKKPRFPVRGFFVLSRQQRRQPLTARKVRSTYDPSESRTLAGGLFSLQIKRERMRLKSHIWVSAYLRRLNSAFISAALVHRGDSDAGAIYIKVAYLDGSCQVYAPLSAHLAAGDARRRAHPGRWPGMAAGLHSRRP